MAASEEALLQETLRGLFGEAREAVQRNYDKELCIRKLGRLLLRHMEKSENIYWHLHDVKFTRKVPEFSWYSNEFMFHVNHHDTFHWTGDKITERISRLWRSPPSML